VSFQQPELFVLLAVVALIAVVVWRFEGWRRRARAAFAGPQAHYWPGSLPWAPAVLLIEAAVLIVIATALPRWGHTELTRDRQGVDFVIVLDISQSMQATDVQPSRIAVAQDQLSRLVEAERGNRFGLVLFAGSAILRSPLTSDAGAMTELIGRASNETSLVRTGSDIGAALDEAGKVLESSDNAGKAVLVVSDGEDFQGTFTERARALREQNILVLSTGVGTAQGSTLEETTRTGTTRTKVDASGRPVISRLNDTTLRSIANVGGGRYIHLGEDNLLAFREDLSRLQQARLGAETQQVPVQRYQVFAGAALALLLLSWFVPLRMKSVRSPFRLRRLRPQPGVAMVLLALVIGGCSGGPTLRSENQKANDAYDRGSYQEALDKYHELLAGRPDVPELSYNAGNAQNRVHNYERAVEEAQRALPPTDPRIGALTYYSLGNHYFALEEYELAYDSYRNALLLDPSDGDSKYNLELSLIMLTAQQQEEQQQPGGQQGNEPQQPEGEPGEGDGEGQPPPQQPLGQTGSPSTEDPLPSPSGGQNEPQQTGPPSPDDLSATELQRSLEEALRGISENLTFEEAQRILDLLREQQQRQRLPGGSGAPAGPDY
jgi:Ca-activated chloride channel family protein